MKSPYVCALCGESIKIGRHKSGWRHTTDSQAEHAVKKVTRSEYERLQGEERRLRLSPRKMAQARYAALAAAVARAIDEADPIGLLSTGAPADEYATEVATVALRASKASSAAEVRRILHEEFLDRFGERTAGPEKAYRAPALHIWEAVATYRDAR
jgi:hypothetical protein